MKRLMRGIQERPLCCSVLQCVDVCCSRHELLGERNTRTRILNLYYVIHVAVCCSVLQCVDVCCSRHELLIERNTRTCILNLYYIIRVHARRRSDRNIYNYQNFKQAITRVHITFKKISRECPRFQTSFHGGKRSPRYSNESPGNPG